MENRYFEEQSFERIREARFSFRGLLEQYDVEIDDSFKNWQRNLIRKTF